MPMKIVCKGCQARYSVADDKVAGKSLKIRCKRCGDVIAIAGETTWHAVVDGDTRGPLAFAELVQLIASGTIGLDAYVWQEGFAEWLPARSVESLVAAIPVAAPDLFAAAETNDEIVVSPHHASTPRTAPTGERHESSVLFSLANLQSLASAGPRTASSDSRQSSPAARSGSATGDGSGLIDIRALARVAAAGGPATAKATVDDLLSIGVGVAPFVPTLGAPLLAPSPPPASRGGLVAVVSVASVAILAAAAVVVAVVTRPPEHAAAATVHHAAPVVIAQVRAPEIAPAPPPAVVAPTPIAEPPVRRRAGPRPERQAHVERLSPAAAHDAPDVDPHHTSLEEMMENILPPSTRNRTATHQDETPPPSAPLTPSRDQVRAALRAVQTAVGACGNGQHGTVTTVISVAGATGRVSSAEVTGAFAGTPAGSCVARAAHAAHFTPFAQATFTVTFPFAI